MRRFFHLLVFAVVAAAGPALAQTERIVAFDADITIREDGSIYVEETIDLIAAGREIKRGIFRDIPTRSIIWPGLNHVAGFRIEKIERDGEPEPWFTRDLAAGIRIYIGDADRRVSRGAHRYVIGYSTTRQLFHHERQDEFYWNVTGNGWAFPIGRATARIRLPGGMSAQSIAGYTGTTGAADKDYRVIDDTGNTIEIETSDRLDPGEGLTVAVFWPAGAVARPDFAQRLRATVSDNAGPAIGFALFIVMVVYFVVIWRRVGRDPEPGTVIPLFHPPDGLSPVAVGFVRNGGFGSGFHPARAFAVAITSLATRGAIRIEEAGRRKYILHAGPETPADLPRGEKAVLDALNGGGILGTPFGDKHAPAIDTARSALRRAFDREYSRLYLRKNRRQWWIGAAIALAAVLISLLGGMTDTGEVAVTVFMTVFSAGFAVPAVLVLYRIFSHLRTSLQSGGRTGIMGSLIALGICLAFLAPVIGVNIFLLDIIPPVAFVIAGASMAVAFAFWFWMTAPTRLGRRTLDEIEGYRLYLSVAEKDRLDAAGGEPAITAALFERHLAYAMALGVEEEWTDKFERSLAAAAASGTSASTYEPTWYSGRGSDWGGLSNMTRSLTGSFSSAASTAATRQSSSSGGSSGGFSGGGGSSGGGGGGGGGGGW